MPVYIEIRCFAKLLLVYGACARSYMDQVRLRAQESIRQCKCKAAFSNFGVDEFTSKL